MTASGTSTAFRPIIRWAGSKRQILHEIERNMPAKYGVYYEPFFGSGCLFFYIRPEHAVLGDFNSKLMSFYRGVKAAPSQILASAVRLRRSASDYYRIRKKYHIEQDPIKRAAMFLYLNKFCFNAIFRTNKKDEFNVPYGSRPSSFPTRRHFLASATLLQRASIMCGDFEQTVASSKAGDFVYLDPPYAYALHRDRGEYGRGSFKVPDLVRLEQTLRILNNKGVMFLMSYIECSEMANITKGYRVQTVPVKRCVASLTSSRLIVNELLIKNY